MYQDACCVPARLVTRKYDQMKKKVVREKKKKENFLMPANVWMKLTHWAHSDEMRKSKKNSVSERN